MNKPVYRLLKSPRFWTILVLVVFVPLGVISALVAAIDNPTANAFAKQIDEGEQKWQKQNISSYQINIFRRNNYLFRVEYTVVVKNGQIISRDLSCSYQGSSKPEKTCNDDYFVPGSGELPINVLFDKARSELENYRRRPNEKFLKLEFDQRYGFPNDNNNHTKDVESDNSWFVTSFQPL